MSNKIKKGTVLGFDTAPVIPDMSKAIDPFIGTYTKSKGIYKFRKVDTDTGNIMVAMCKRIPTALDRTLSVYLYRSWYMFTKDRKEKEVKLSIATILTEIGLDPEKESNVNNFIDSLAFLRQLVIKGTTPYSTYDFNWVASLEVDAFSKYIIIQVPEILTRMFAKKKVRQQRVDVIKISKSKYTQAMWEFLITNGRSGNTPMVRFTKESMLIRLEIYTKKMDTQKKILSRALKEIHTITGFAYKYNRKAKGYELIQEDETPTIDIQPKVEAEEFVPEVVIQNNADIKDIPTGKDINGNDF